MKRPLACALLAALALASCHDSSPMLECPESDAAAVILTTVDPVTGQPLCTVTATMLSVTPPQPFTIFDEEALEADAGVGQCNQIALSVNARPNGPVTFRIEVSAPGYANTVLPDVTVIFDPPCGDLRKQQEIVAALQREP